MFVVYNEIVWDTVFHGEDAYINNIEFYRNAELIFTIDQDEMKHYDLSIGCQKKDEYTLFIHAKRRIE